MKTKYADLSHWSNKPSSLYRQINIDAVDFKGDVSLLKFNHIMNPVSFRAGNELDYIIIANDYFWIEHFPDEANHIMTTIIDDKGNLVYHYFDVILSSDRTKEGIPYFVDLCLDVILLPNNEILVLDLNDLDEALNKQEIDRTQFDLALKEMEFLKSTLINEKNNLINRWTDDFKSLKELI